MGAEELYIPDLGQLRAWLYYGTSSYPNIRAGPIIKGNILCAVNTGRVFTCLLASDLARLEVLL